VHRAIEAALTAPSPHGSVPWRFALVETAAARQRLCDVMLAAWADDLRADGLDEAAIADRLAAGDVLRRAPYLIVPCLAAAGSGRYPEGRRDLADRRSYWLAMGAGIENLLVALAAEGLGSFWSNAPLFCMDVVARELTLPDGWLPVAAVPVGHALAAPPGHQPRDPGDYTITC
jgi:coenzyme F420-0:L-glutamate ligase/coenzyme F420-1:gamma-L-glutamate ligase